ncbi:MAG: GAF domain-containing sensor histidine kinase [Anaerolineae bacterium]|nr:GAF domain-containing sensor histidine kinase [Anaerolineae bacterium]
MSEEERFSIIESLAPYLERLGTLLALRDPEALAAEVLTMLVADFGVRAASLFYASRPSLRVRRGQLTPALEAHIDRWEAGVERRIGTGPWQIAEPGESILAAQPIKGTQLVAIYSLILDGQKVVGAIFVAYPRELVPRGNQRTGLASFLQAAGKAVNLVGELSLLRERLGQLTMFYQVSQSMTSTLDLRKVLEHTIQLATAVLDAGASALMMIDEKDQQLVFEYTHGEMGDLLHQKRIPLDEGIAGWVATHQEPLIVNDVQGDPRFSPHVDAHAEFVTDSIACVPIQIRGRTIGVLEARNKRSQGGFDAEDLSLMITTANQAGIAIENARLYQSLRDERDRIIQAQEDVRRQVARNLHDGTVQFLSAIAMGIDHLERLLRFKPEAARSELQALRDLTRQAMTQARLALFELRPLILETQGLGPALETYVQQLQDHEGFGVHLETIGTLPDLNNSVSATIFSIVQEAVTNAKKHASPRDVWLRVSRKNGWLQVVVEDNGSGFDAEAVERNYDRKGSIGLLSMKERAELIDARLTIESSATPPNTGTKVTLHIPIPDEATQQRQAATQK